MCGRMSLSASPDEVRATFHYQEQPNFPPRYNIAPTQPIAIVRENHEHAPQFGLVRWGLIPPWVKDPREFTLIINARSETAAEKPSFKNALRRRRCLIPANGFYEWRRTGGKAKQAYWVPPADGGVIALAGMWESWMGKDGEEMESAAILTTTANETLAPIHHRMPVVIQPDGFARWLDHSSDSAKEIADLLVPAQPDFFTPIPVSDRVNKVANSDPDVQARVEIDVDQRPEAPRAKSKSATSDEQLDLL